MTIARQPNKLKAPVIKGTLGLFISPAGDCFPVEQSHIGTIIRDPARFGVTTQKIEAAYAKYNEPMGVEGRARGEILHDLIMRGWIRLRRYVRPQEKWSVTVNELDDETGVKLKDWAEKTLSGALGFREDDPFKPVEITALSSGDVQSPTVEAIARGCFLNSRQL